jgi:hypothetical protein
MVLRLLDARCRGLTIRHTGGEWNESAGAGCIHSRFASVPYQSRGQTLPREGRGFRPLQLAYSPVLRLSPDLLATMPARAQRRNVFYGEPPLNRSVRRRRDSLAPNLVPGTQLFVRRTGYRHHGIYSDNGRIIHYAGRLSHAQGLIEEVSLAQFANGRAIRIGRLPVGPFDADEIVRRARSRLGERRYDLLQNNCEHFCNWCQLGESRSSQAERLARLSRLLRGPVERLYTLLRSYRGQRTPFASALGAE